MKNDKQEQLLNIVKNNYEAIAADFDTTRKKALWPLLAEYASLVKSGESVLDVGCGNGRLASAFINKDIEYLGIDNSENLIELAKKNLETEQVKSHLPAGEAGKSPNVAKAMLGKKVESFENPQSAIRNLKFLHCDILELDKLDIGQFDWVFSIAVIHHLPSQELRAKALKNLKSKLKSGGKLVFSVWRPWGSKALVLELCKTIGMKLIGRNPYAWNDLVFVWKNNQSQRYYHFFTKCELKKLIKKAGLELVEMKTEKRNYYLVVK